MAIAAITANEFEVVTSNSTTSSIVFPTNVAAGSLVVIGAHVWTPSGGASQAAGWLAKTAGTSTIGTIAFDRGWAASFNSQYTFGFYSFLVTGGGSLTLTLTSTQAGSYFLIGVGEYSGSWNDTRLETGNNTNGTGTTPSSGAMTVAGPALLFGIMSDDRASTTTTTPDADYTELAEDEGVVNQPGSVLRRIVTSGLTDTVNWTIGTSLGWSGGGVAYRELVAPVLSAPGVNSITSTSAIPKVTLTF